MKKSEIDEFLESRFKKIEKYFRKSIVSFESDYIQEFRTEIQRLKVFLHLISMESEDGLSCRITKRMKTIYGYFGIIRNLEMQISETKEYAKRFAQNAPACYINNLESELQYWKKLSLEFIDATYSFNNDKQEIMAVFPDKLNKKSIKKFVHYTLYELNTLSGRTDDEALESVRKFMEDIYYNYDFISPFFPGGQNKIFNKKAVKDCLKLFVDFRNKCVAIALLRAVDTSISDEPERQLLKEMENEWMYTKKDVKNKLVTTLRSMNIPVNKMKDLAVVNDK